MTSHPPQWQTSYKTIRDANSHLLESGKLSDVIFVVGSEKAEVPAHKLILMTRSSAFEAMLERCSPGLKKVEIPEVGRNSFTKFLNFLYTDKLVTISSKETAEVLYLANKCNVPELVLECSNRLSRAIVVKNAIFLNHIATKSKQENLRKQTEEFILRNGKAVFLDCGILKIDESNFCAFLKNDRLRVDERTLFQAVMRWADNKCKLLKLESTAENQRAVLKNLLPLIRFPLMSPKDFTDEVIRKHKGLLADSETISMYMYFNTGLPFPTSPSLPFTERNRAGDILFCVNLFKLSETALPNMRRLAQADQTTCRNQIGYSYATATGICETATSIRPDRCVRIRAVVLEQDGCKPLIQSFTEQCRHHRRLEDVQYQELTTSISISIVDSNGARIRLQEQQVEDATKITFENGIYVGKNKTCEIKLTTTGSSVARSWYTIPRRNNLVPSTSEKINCESTVVSFEISAPKTNCVVRKQRLYDNINCDCISVGHIKAVHFSI